MRQQDGQRPAHRRCERQGSPAPKPRGFTVRRRYGGIGGWGRALLLVAGVAGMTSPAWGYDVTVPPWQGQLPTDHESRYLDQACPLYSAPYFPGGKVEIRVVANNPSDGLFGVLDGIAGRVSSDGNAVVYQDSRLRFSCDIGAGHRFTVHGRDDGRFDVYLDEEAFVVAPGDGPRVLGEIELPRGNYSPRLEGEWHTGVSYRVRENAKGVSSSVRSPGIVAAAFDASGRLVGNSSWYNYGEFPLTTDYVYFYSPAVCAVSVPTPSIALSAKDDGRGVKVGDVSCSRGSHTTHRGFRLRLTPTVGDGTTSQGDLRMIRDGGALGEGVVYVRMAWGDNVTCNMRESDIVRWGADNRTFNSSAYQSSSLNISARACMSGAPAPGVWRGGGKIEVEYP